MASGVTQEPVAISGNVGITGTVTLPSGASTSAKQDTGNTSVANIDTKTPTLGQAAMAASSPVVIASNQSAVPVSGTFWQSTQPISGSVSVSNLPATQPISGSVSVSNFPASQAVTGTFFQSTQPISAASLPLPSGAATAAKQPALGAAGTASADVLTVQGIASMTALKTDGSGVTQPVSGTFWQATQPISGSVSVSNFPSSQAVTGSFFQATQPVSGTVTSNVGTTNGLALDATLTGGTQKAILRTAAKGSTVAGDATSTAVDANTQALDVQVKNFPASQAVTGTFWQATQPVSGTVTSNQGGTWTVQPGNTANTTAWKVDGSAVTQPVSGTLSANASQTGTWTVQPGNTANTTAWKVDGSAVTQPVSGTVTANTGTLPTLTKGTQGSTGFSTQDLKDAGRNQTNYFMAAPIVSTSTDALMSLTGYKSGAAVAATTTPAVVTTAKTYRVTSITLTYVTIVTTPGAVKFTLRANTGGVVAISSPAVRTWVIGEPTGIAPVAGKYNTVSIPLPDGIEFAAGTGIGLSMVGLGATGAAAVVGFGHADLGGFEY